jgi:UDP-2-acetamido-3-amino-2,3-dideoxy-glucuronate N-acetyltransferase
VTIEDDVFLGPSMVFTNVINPRSHVVRKNEFLTTIVKKGASVGANATIVCGNNIGQYGFIGAGAVVTKSVLDFELIAGVPGKRIGWMSKDGYPLTFKNGIAVCPGTKQKYVLKNNEVKSIE